MQRTGNAGRCGTGLSRKDFLKLGGAGLAGAAHLETAGCGGSSQGGGNELIFAWGPDYTGALSKLIEVLSGVRGHLPVFHLDLALVLLVVLIDQLRTEFQAGCGEIDIITGDVIWPAQFAANGYILDLSDSFTEADAFLDGPMESSTYDGKV